LFLVHKWIFTFSNARNAYTGIDLNFCLYYSTCAFTFSALTLLVGHQEGHPTCKKLDWWVSGVVICLGRGADLHMAQLMPLPLTISCSSKSRLVLPSRFYLSGSGSPGSPRQSPGVHKMVAGGGGSGSGNSIPLGLEVVLLQFIGFINNFHILLKYFTCSDRVPVVSEGSLLKQMEKEH